VPPELQDELSSPVQDYGVWAALKTVYMVDEGVYQLLRSQFCGQDEVPHFGQSTDDDEEVLIFDARMYILRKWCDVVDRYIRPCLEQDRQGLQEPLGGRLG
jgi:hypothetical protein